MLDKKLITFGLLVTFLAGLSVAAMAAVSPEEAARLNKDLTPFGAERAGNAEGTIPAWEGGVTEPPAGVDYKPGDFLVDLFADDEVLFSISAANVDEYADRLSDGQIALLKRYPESYRIDVYPTHRTAAAPQWVYDNTMKNATRATLTEDRQGMRGAYGGIPFPLPQSGEEAIYNHLARWKGTSFRGESEIAVAHSNGSVTYGSKLHSFTKYPYYNEDGSLETFKGSMSNLFTSTVAPRRRKGELMVMIDDVNPYEKPRQVWGYLPGQRRVRRAPTLAYDTPVGASFGLAVFDERFIFNGALDRYDWKLVGKKEMFIPYNTNKATTAAAKDLLTPHHANPDLVRWELHRVWVVEATLKDGKRHVYAKRKIYLDEDTWIAALGDNYDDKLKIWRTGVNLLPCFYNLPAVRDLELINYDFQVDDYTAGPLFNNSSQLLTLSDVPDKVFTPAYLKRQGRR